MFDGDSLKALKFIKKNTVFCIAAFVAIITCFFVPPDKEYAEYFDLKTLSCLFCVLAVVCALKNINFFYILAKKAVEAAVERAGIAEQIDALRDEKTGEIDLNALSGLLGENPGLSGLLGENSKLGDLSELAGMLEQFQNLDAGEMESLMQQMEQMQGG